MRTRAGDSLFFAIRPEREAAARIASCCEGLRTAHGLNGRPIAPERLHITLHFLGRFQGVPADVVNRAGDVAGSVQAASFDIALDRVQSFHNNSGRYPLVLGSASPSPGLTGLQKILSGMLKEAGLRNELRGFKPHLTLLYDERRVAEQAIAPIRWAVGEFLLVHNSISLGRHDVLKAWTLQARTG